MTTSNDPLIRPGDQLQSAASRLAAYVRDLGSAVVPYEVFMAVLETESAVAEWTEVRRDTRIEAIERVDPADPLRGL